jgi:hypothetical protein
MDSVEATEWTKGEVAKVQDQDAKVKMQAG